MPVRKPVTRWNPLELPHIVPSYLLALSVLMTTCLTVGALISSRAVYLGPLHATAGGLLFPITYACIVVIAEVYSLAVAMHLMSYSTVALALTAAVVEIADRLPPHGPPGSVNAAFHMLYRSDAAPVLVALFSYTVSLTCGIALLAYMARRTRGGLLWARVTAVPMACQLIGTCIGLPLTYMALRLQLPPAVFITRCLYAISYACATMPLVYASILYLRLQERPVFLAMLQLQRQTEHKHIDP